MFIQKVLLWSREVWNQCPQTSRVLFTWAKEIFMSSLGFSTIYERLVVDCLDIAGLTFEVHTVNSTHKDSHVYVDAMEG